MTGLVAKWARVFRRVLAALAAAFVVAVALGQGAVVLPAAAVQPDEVLTDPLLETRARDISKNLRCLVCQNQSIDDSNAPLARDLRVLVRERLSTGDSDRNVLDFVVARYGDYVLLKPPLNAVTYALWFGPAAIAALAPVALVAFFRRRARHAGAEPSPLTPEERRRLARLTGGEGG